MSLSTKQNTVMKDPYSEHSRTWCAQKTPHEMLLSHDVLFCRFMNCGEMFLH